MTSREKKFVYFVIIIEIYVRIMYNMYDKKNFIVIDKISAICYNKKDNNLKHNLNNEVSR